MVYLNNGSIVFDGSCQEFKQRLGGKRIQCTSDLSLLQLQQLTGVTRVEQQGSVQTVFSDNVEATLRELLVKSDQVANLLVTEMSLEDAVLKMDETQNNLEEQAA